MNGSKVEIVLVRGGGGEDTRVKAVNGNVDCPLGMPAARVAVMVAPVTKQAM